MIHYLKPDNLDSLQKFTNLFNSEDNFGLKKCEMSQELKKLHLYTSSYSNGHGGGIDHDKLGASLRAMGEAIERYCISQSRADYFGCSYNDLTKRGFNCLDPKSYQMFSKEQSIVKYGEAFNVSRSSSIDWTWFEDVFMGNKILLPNGFNRFLNRKPPVYFAGSSSGYSCGKSAEQAKLGALLELIERDAFMFYWCTQNSPKQIDLSNLSSELKEGLIPFKEILEHATLFFLETDVKSVITILAVYRGGGVRVPFLSVAGASSLDLDKAIIKALQELAHCIQIQCAEKNKANLGDFDKVLWDFSDHCSLYAFTNLKKAYGFLFPKNPLFINYKNIISRDLDDPQKNLDLIVSDLLKMGHRLYFKNNTPRDIFQAGFSVYRAFSPDLISIWPMHRYRKLGFSRYFKLARKMKLRKQPRSIKDFNSFPHPYP